MAQHVTTRTNVQTGNRYATLMQFVPILLEATLVVAELDFLELELYAQTLMNVQLVQPHVALRLPVSTTLVATHARVTVDSEEVVSHVQISTSVTKTLIIVMPMHFV